MAAPREHPIRRLGLPLADIARRAGVCRVVLSQVVSGKRNRPGIETLRKLTKQFPQLNFDELADWKWSRRGGVKRGEARHGRG